jgi:thiosulfate/3-mercaptopyruvate sulfurtransferase
MTKPIGALVSTDWLADELDAEDLRVFDTTVLMSPGDDGSITIESGADAWAQGHVPTSGHLDLIRELSDPTSSLGFTAPSPDMLAAALAARGVGDGTRVVLYDTVFNMWATRVWWLMRSIGFDDAAVLDGGLVAWRHDGRTTSTDPAPQHPPAKFTPNPRPGSFTDSDGVEAAVAAGSTCILNALSEDNHNGNDPGYGRPGHIPGASNIPAMNLVDHETRRYRPLDELRAEFAAAGTSGRPTITYCGGGIAATSDAFVLHVLGHDDVSVYDGSLRDWTTRDLPLEF